MNVVLHQSAQDQAHLIPLLERIGRTLKPGQVVRHLSEAGELHLQRGHGMDARLHVSREPVAMPGIANQRTHTSLAPTGERRPTIELIGPQLWRDIHTTALRLETPEARQAHHDSIEALLPCGECKTHWREWKRAHPPNVATADAYFAATVADHNGINVRLGKPVLAVEEARALYHYSTPS